ncbi:MAG: hypothetical protein WC600_03390 [Desulfobaccales bacterium]
MSEEENDYAAYKAYIDLWAKENPIKTNKLQVLLVVNSLLVSALNLAGGFIPKNWFIFLAGAVFSFIWVLSIGRTSLFQKVWQAKANEIASKPEHVNNPKFQILKTEAAEKKAPVWLQVLGCMPSKYYLLGAPILFSLAWAISLIFILIHR